MVESEQERIARAMRVALDGSGKSQSQVADEVGVSQPTISRWTRKGFSELDSLKRFELSCGKPRGWVLAAAGWYLAAMTVEEAIRMDSRLDAPAPLGDDDLVRRRLAVAAGMVLALPDVSLHCSCYDCALVSGTLAVLRGLLVG